MQIVFMNQLSKNSGESAGDFAQLWIGEEEGVWHLGWRDFGQNPESADSIWYEGSSWNEMLGVYRHELAVKMGEGYRPLIDGVFHEETAVTGRNQEQMKLQYYSEQHGNEAVYEELCAWRRKRASSERKAPYLLASNRLLRLLSAYLPQSLEELLQIPGVGEAKAEQYGPEILSVTSAAERSHSFPLRWVGKEIEEESFTSWLYKQREIKYKKQLDRLRLRRQLLEGIADGCGLEELKERSQYSRREILEVVEELEKDGYIVDPLIQRELMDMPPGEQEAVWNAYRELGDLFLKPVLHKVYGEDAAPEGGLEMYYERLRLIRIRFRRESTGAGAVVEHS
ncbi:HRDC domain-containing protein [Paenibacillus sophorae]|uniref:HRDC domain-containing protein n=1 Tax=Paenibacillus sophorae TaxID=1333845 RepID=A0A1H8MCU9_9BACL|nr:HRDC domain-containing protein [Paenibacillus sophorae]QWU18304.1 HRDC domain-containing protein [Paenibacillus sophorae]SEO15090.1 HRDC domain-containing protein [Paenibacillus sophorae]